MLAWVRLRWEEFRAAWAESMAPPEYRFGDVPTADEMAAKAARLEGELSLERARRKTAEEDLARANEEIGRLRRQIVAYRLEGQPTTVVDGYPLVPAEIERLALLAEELGEAVQAVGKVLRHGYESVNPLRLDSPNNRVLLERELGDVRAATRLLTLARDLRAADIAHHAERKGQTVGRWLHYQARPAEVVIGPDSPLRRHAVPAKDRAAFNAAQSQEAQPAQ